MHFELVFVILFTVATAVAIGARWLKLPYTVALVLAGLLLGSTHAVEAPHLTKELLFAVILPGLVFEAAYHIDAHKFWKERFAINALAVPGVVIAIALTAAILAPVANALAFVSGFGLVHALVFAALIVATDPIAVVALFKSLGAPKRLTLLVEGESLVNDGTGVVLFTLVIGFANGAHMTVAQGALDFLRVVGLGGLVGAAVGLAVSHAIRRIDDPMIELTLTIVAAYGSFVVAERFHGSGVIATVVAGMLCGNYAARVGMSPTTRVAVETAWDYVAFALNSIVFLLIGFEVHIDALLQSWKPIVVAYLAVMVARAVVVYTVSALMRRSHRRLPWSWTAVITWSGLRGALSMVLALGLPADFPHRALLLNMTFGVVLLSILLQGLSMAPLLRRLGLSGVRSDERRAHDLQTARLTAASAGLGEIERLRREHAAPQSALDSVRDAYRKKVAEAEEALQRLHASANTLRDEEDRALQRRLLFAERDGVLHAGRHGQIGDEALAQLLTDIDARLQRLDEDS